LIKITATIKAIIHHIAVQKQIIKTHKKESKEYKKAVVVLQQHKKKLVATKAKKHKIAKQVKAAKQSVAKYKKIVSVTKKIQKTLKRSKSVKKIGKVILKKVKHTTNLIKKKPHAVMKHAIKVIAKSKEAILKKQIAVVMARKVITHIAITITHHITVIHHLMSLKVITKHQKQLIIKHKKTAQGTKTSPGQEKESVPQSQGCSCQA
jgi:hypothetical protein